MGDHLPSDLELDVRAFLDAVEAKGCSRFTREQYRSQLGLFTRWAIPAGTDATERITPECLTRYFITLRERGLKPNSLHAAFRVLRRYLRWYERTHRPANWQNPILNVEAPRVPRRRLPAPPFEHIRAICQSIPGHSLQADRDRALIMFLFDTGLRAGECLALNLGDLDIKRGRVHVVHTKSGQDRYAYLNPLVVKAIVQYLRHRPKELPATAPLWITLTGHGNAKPGARLTYSGLRLMLERRANEAGVPMPRLHGLRRAFATAKHEQGVTALDLQNMLGHSDGQTLWRYVDLTDRYMEERQRATSPVARYLAE